MQNDSFWARTDFLLPNVAWGLALFSLLVLVWVFVREFKKRKRLLHPQSYPYYERRLEVPPGVLETVIPVPRTRLRVDNEEVARQKVEALLATFAVPIVDAEVAGDKEVTPEVTSATDAPVPVIATVDCSTETPIPPVQTDTPLLQVALPPPAETVAEKVWKVDFGWDSSPIISRLFPAKDFRSVEMNGDRELAIARAKRLVGPIIASSLNGDLYMKEDGTLFMRRTPIPKAKTIKLRLKPTLEVITSILIIYVHWRGDQEDEALLTTLGLIWSQPETCEIPIMRVVGSRRSKDKLFFDTSPHVLDHFHLVSVRTKFDEQQEQVLQATAA